MNESKGVYQLSLQDLLDLAADQGDWQLEMIIKPLLENELDNETPTPQSNPLRAETDHAK